jgi:uncharacterized protein
MSVENPVRSLPFARPLAALGLGLGLAVCSAAVPAHELPDRYRVAVSGEGEVRAEPDQALVVLGVESRKPTLEAARTDVNRKIEALLKLTRDLKIPDTDVRSSRLQIQPEYNWQEQTRERLLIGYYVARQVTVDLRNLEQLGLLMERAVTAGANQIQDPALDSSKRRDFERQALALAAKDARANAEVLAGALSASVGAAHTVSASSGSPRPMVYSMARTAKADVAAGGESPGSYQSGELAFTASVQVDFDLVPTTAR